MDERTALRLLADDLPAAGDDAAVVDDLVLTTDMLHETTDFPEGTTRFTAGWRAVGASLSDVAAMGAEATAAVAVYADSDFEETDLRAFVRGAREVCAAVDAEYVGGDLDDHAEFTTASTAVGRTDDPVYRSGARPGDLVVVTGTLGRSAAALRYFGRGDADRGNDLFRFTPRLSAGRALAGSATAMLDSSDGLARSLHQLAEASDCGVEFEWDALPVDESVAAVAESDADRREMTAFFGEDFELVATVPESALSAVRAASPTDISVIGGTTESGGAGEGDRGNTTSRVVADDGPVPDRGFTHGE